MLIRSYLPAIPSIGTLRYLRQIVLPRPCASLTHHRSTRPFRRKFHERRSGKTPNPAPPIDPTTISYEFEDNPALYSEFPSPGSITPQIYRYHPDEREARARGGATKVAKKKKAKTDSVDLHSLTAYRKFTDLVNRKQFAQAEATLYACCDENLPDSIVRAMGKNLMKAMITYERMISVARIFHFLVEQVETIDARCLNLCLRSYLERRMWDRALSVFNHYARRVIPDHSTYAYIVNAYVGKKELEKAEQFIRTLLAERKPVTATTFAYLLGGIRLVTGSFSEMERVFKWMESTGVNMHAGVFNIMLEEALTSGDSDLARKYVHMMSEKNIRITADTFGIFMGIQAKANDWDSVRKTMARLREKGLRVPSKSLNTVLAAYARSMGTQDIDRLFNMFLADGTRPSAMSYNILIHAYLRAGDREKAFQWIEELKSKGYRPNSSTFNTVFADLARKSDPAILRRLYQAAKQNDPALIDTRTRGMLAHSMSRSRYQHSPIRVVFPWQEAEERDSEVIDQIEWMLASERAEEALDVFNQSLARKDVPSERLVRLAVKACFALPEADRARGKTILRVAREKGAPVNAAMLAYMERTVLAQVRLCQGSYARLLQRLSAVYEFQETNKMPISHRLLTQVAQALIISNDVVGAVHVMYEISNTRWGIKKPFDIAALTILLRAYSLIGDLEGLRWTVNRLMENEETPDLLFFMYLGRARRAMPVQRQHDVLELIDKCKEHKQRMMEKRSGLAGEVFSALKKDDRVWRPGETLPAAVRERNPSGVDRHEVSSSIPSSDVPAQSIPFVSAGASAV